MSEKKEGIHFDAFGWRNFPTDKTMMEFRKDYKNKSHRAKLPSDKWLQDTLKILEIEETEKVICDDIFALRYSDNKTKQDPTTKPRCIPIEIQQLLCSILSEKDKNKKIKGEEFAQKVFVALADYWEPQNNRDINNYPALMTLHHPRIQQALLRKFEAPLRQRLIRLYSCIFSDESDVQIDKLAYIMEQLDFLLANLSENKTYSDTTTATQDLQALYTNLLIFRKQVLNQRAIEEADVSLLDWNPEVDPSLIENMNNQLLFTPRSPKPEEIEAFWENYNQYLLFNMDQTIQSSVNSFSEKYRQLADYYSNSISKEELRELVTEELKTFTEFLFSELDKMETISPSVKYQPKHANVAYLRMRLENVQKDILDKLQEAIRLLRAVYALFFFSIPIPDITNEMDVYTAADTKWLIEAALFLDNGKSILQYNPNKVAGVSIMIEKEIKKLFDECGNVITSDTVHDTLAEKVLSAYHNNIAVIYPYEEHTDNQIKMLQSVLSTTPNTSLRHLNAMAILLRLTCKLFVAEACKKAIETLSEEYDKIRKYF